MSNELVTIEVGDIKALQGDYVFQWLGWDLHRITIPHGSITGLSVPKMVRHMLEKFPGPALAHHYLYMFKGDIPFRPVEVYTENGWKIQDVSFSRYACDQILAQGLEMEGMPQLDLDVIYWACRVLGRQFWGNYPLAI